MITPVLSRLSPIIIEPCRIYRLNAKIEKSHISVICDWPKATVLRSPKALIFYILRELLTSLKFVLDEEYLCLIQIILLLCILGRNHIFIHIPVFSQARSKFCNHFLRHLKITMNDFPDEDIYVNPVNSSSLFLPLEKADRNDVGILFLCILFHNLILNSKLQLSLTI